MRQIKHSRFRRKFLHLRFLVIIFFATLFVAVVLTGRFFFLTTKEVESLESGTDRE